ncbi:hypothetical protein ABZP36_009540 [Zizania latifolia]
MWRGSLGIHPSTSPSSGREVRKKIRSDTERGVSPLPIAIFVVPFAAAVHLPSSSPSQLPHICRRRLRSCRTFAVVVAFAAVCRRMSPPASRPLVNNGRQGFQNQVMGDNGGN